MSTSLATKPFAERSSGPKAKVVVGFYLITFLMGGFFLFVGGRLGVGIDLTAAVFYMIVTVLFYALNRGARTAGN
ncbi:MAG TPA: hypothetical protein VFM77_04600 [Terriglobales bacterium]|nr:hypothetical protein [Terriglobales bacterium]